MLLLRFEKVLIKTVLNKIFLHREIISKTTAKVRGRGDARLTEVLEEEKKQKDNCKLALLNLATGKMLQGTTSRKRGRGAVRTTLRFPAEINGYN